MTVTVLESGETLRIFFSKNSYIPPFKRGVQNRINQAVQFLDDDFAAYSEYDRNKDGIVTVGEVMAAGEKILRVNDRGMLEE